MSNLSYFEFIRTLPAQVMPHLPPGMGEITPHQPFRWIIQFHAGDKRIHYEVSRVPRQKDLELALHFESRNKALNAQLLLGFQRHLFELKDILGPQLEAEMWDRGWAKVYEVYPEPQLTSESQTAVGARMATLITTLHPFLRTLLQTAA